LQGRVKNFLIVVSIIALIGLGAAWVILLGNSQAKTQSFLYITGGGIQYAESAYNTTNEGYLVLHPGESYYLNATFIILSSVNRAASYEFFGLNTDSPTWLNLQLSSVTFTNGTKISILITPQNSSPLGSISSIIFSASNGSLTPATIYFTVVPQSEKIVPEKSFLVSVDSSDYMLSSSFLISYKNDLKAITASLPSAGIYVSTAENQSAINNSKGLYLHASVRDKVNYTMPLQPLPIVYTLYSEAKIPSSLITKNNYTISLEFTFADGTTYNYSQTIPVINISNATGTGINQSNSAYFTIVASDQGYNQSILHGAPSNPWPVIKVKLGTSVSIRVINNDTIEPHGFAINHYFDRGVAIQPGQSYTVSFVADEAGNFIIYCNIPCSIHVYMIAELQVSE
jgi:hypothetical protein